MPPFARWFLQCFGSERPHAMPAPLMALLALVRARAEEELVLAEGSLAYEIMFTGLRHRWVSCTDPSDPLDTLRRPPWI